MQRASIDIGERRIWNGIDLTVEAGEFVAILGPNGAGKSTLVKAILGLRAVNGGRIEVFGRRPGDSNDQIGYLPQRRSFDPSVRVRGVDIVRLGLDGDRWGTPLPLADRWSPRRRADRRRIDEVIELVGAGAYARRPIGRLSGGEQQRLLIAQALVRQPSLLLLDEPLDSLDLTNQASVAALLDTVSRRQGVAVLLVAHDVNLILPYLDKVVYLAQGSAVTGKPEDVISSETLSRLYETRIEVLSTSDGRLVVVGQPEPPAHHTDRHTH